MQGGFNLGNGAMGNRFEAYHGPNRQGEWSQQGGRIQVPQGGNRNDRRGAQDWKNNGREKTLIVNEGNRPQANPDIKCFQCLGTGHF